MAVSTGVSGKQFVSALELNDERDIRGGVVNISDVASFTDVLQKMNVFSPLPAKMPYWYHHVNEENVLVGDTTGAPSIVGSGSATTLSGVLLTAPSSGFFRKRDVVRLPNGANAWVISVTPDSGQDTLVLKSLNATNLTLVAGGLLTWVGNALTESDANRLSLRFANSAIYNHVQIFQETSTSTDIQTMSHTTTDNAPWYVQDHIDKINNLKLGMSAAMIGGQISVARFSDASPTLADATTGYGAQTTRGLDQYVSTYGSTRQNATTGVVVRADIIAQQAKFLATKAPKSMMIFGATQGFYGYSTYLKNLGSAGVTSVRMQVDGKHVDLSVESYNDGAFRYKFMPLNTMDYQPIFPTTGLIASSLYYIPEGRVTLKDGTSAPYFGAKYMDKSRLPLKAGGNATWKNIILETLDGKLAPQSNGTTNNFSAAWDAWVGLDILGSQHMLRERVIF